MEDKMKKIDGLELPKNKEFLKSILLAKAAQKNAKSFWGFRIIPVFAAALAVAAVGFYMKIDYNDSNTQRNALGGIWCTYDDHAQGGNSTVWPPASTSCENLFVKSSPGYGNTGYAIRITGNAGTKPGDNYIGVDTFLSERSSCPHCNGIDIRAYHGIEFKLKGTVTAGKVMFIIPHEGKASDKKFGTCVSLTDYADYGADITKDISLNWKTVRLDFKKDLRQPLRAKKENLVGIDEVLSDANLIKWQYSDGQGHPVDIWIDDLQLY